MTGALVPVPVLLPLGMATLLLATAHFLPPRAGRIAAMVTALAVLAACVWLATEAVHGPIPHWFGGWTPSSSHRPGVVLGISFLCDPASAAVAGFSALLFAATFVFSWGYFDEVHSHFEVLMLLFMAAICGFSLTHDLFNLFVWFELMSVAAFAVTAYPLGKSSLEGAFNFTITNTVAGFMMLAGIGLLYARTGTLDFAAMGRAITAAGSDPVLSGGFCLVAAGLLTKAAILPFHMWLSDAHAVAPSPVSVIFSGIMVSVALFGLAKLIAQVFVGDDQVMALVHTVFLWLGVTTALVGAAMAWAQRHLKRLLAFSTIGHLGIMLTGIATVTPRGMAGFVLYLVGHGLVKGALFMLAGILLALRASGDEIVLYRQGRDLWAPGLAMAFAGLLLGGLPLGLLHEATDILLPVAPAAAVAASTALTGAAVLRATGRIFLGLSGAPGPEITAPTVRSREKDERPLLLMLAPCAGLLVLASLPGELVTGAVSTAAARLMDPTGHLPAAHLSMPDAIISYAPIVLAVALVVVSVVRRRPVSRPARRLSHLETVPFRWLQALHSGLVTDYVVWMLVGLAVLAAATGLL